MGKDEIKVKWTTTFILGMSSVEVHKERNNRVYRNQSLNLEYSKKHPEDKLHKP